MNKVVLIMDEMPECCADCSCGYFESGTKKLNLICGATGEDANNVGKPEWCPLRELPERSDHPEHCDNGRFDAGWNGCLDAIEGGAHGKEQSE
jgi:hypothetical protein